MAEQAGHGDGQGASPGRDPGLPDGVAGAPARDARLAGFAKGGEWAACPPSASLAVALEAASGPGWRCAGASREEMFGLLRQWQALESRAAAAKLGVLRALIREDDQPLPGGGYHGDLPAGWTKSLTHEVALALSMPAVSAERLMWLAWDLEGRLPGIGALLAAGTLTTSKAQGIDEALQQLSGEDAAAAEAMILPELPGKTYGQAVKLAVRAAVTVDPESATRRRQDAERNRSRVEMFREQSGAAALAGRELPTDQALAAEASVCARAAEYQDSGAFPDGTRMDQYRAAAYLDLLNGVTAVARIAAGLLPGACPAGDPPAGEPADGGGCACRECDGSCVPPNDDDEDGDGGHWDGGTPGSEHPPGGRGPGPDNTGGGNPDDGAPGSEARSGGPCAGPGDRDNGDPHHSDPDRRDPDRRDPCGEAPGSEGPPDDGSGSSGSESGSSGLGDGRHEGDDGSGGGSGSPGDGSREGDGDRPGHCDGGPGDGPGPGPDLGGEPRAGQPSASAAGTARLADLILPLATLLGLAERPGEGYRLGPLDPDLCRSLAIAAAGSPSSRLCVTVTDLDGIAVGHGCARADRRGKRLAGAQPVRPGPSRGHGALPARVNLTITTARLTELTAATGPPGQAWGFTRNTDPGPPGGHGDWTLTLPNGTKLTVELRPVPTFGCDHRYESRAYQPNETLRHLVQIRDGQCTFPTCSRHARESDFEHAVPYDRGGRTCACNAGARSRACHQVKQSPGWRVTQPRPGWHQWETPGGRTYLQGPKRYPV